MIIANLSVNRNVRIGRTTNRQLGFLTPSASDTKCDYFQERFVRHGVAIKENRAVCEKANSGIICDYQKEVNGLPMCLRYWYGPKYEIVDEIDEPYVQKTNAVGQLLFFEADGVTETSMNTGHPILVPLSENRPIPYVEASKYQEVDSTKSPLYWDNSTPPKKTRAVTSKPVWAYESPQFYSEQYEDSHEKIFGINDGRLGWHKDV